MKKEMYCIKCGCDITHTEGFYPHGLAAGAYCYDCAKEEGGAIGPLVTYEEAVDLTQSAYGAWEGEYETGDDWSKMHEARDLAVNALRKQIPELPNIWGDGFADDKPVYDSWDCPYCGKTYELECEHYDYCPACGQRINWEEPEDNDSDV